jgi:1-deoxy-D-xylulose-5-phosphate reductoisomerase
VLNAANEVAVAAFLEFRIPFTAIPEVICAAMDAYDQSTPSPVRTLADVRQVDGWATEFAAERTGGVKSKL